MDETRNQYFVSSKYDFFMTISDKDVVFQMAKQEDSNN